jgi:hypothetical protein
VPRRNCSCAATACHLCPAATATFHHLHPVSNVTTTLPRSPITAAMASTVVRMMLLYGSCSVSEYPDVWQCVRSSQLDSCTPIARAGQRSTAHNQQQLRGQRGTFLAPMRSRMISAHSVRAARSFATCQRRVHHNAMRRAQNVAVHMHRCTDTDMHRHTHEQQQLLHRTRDRDERLWPLPLPRRATPPCRSSCRYRRKTTGATRWSRRAGPPASRSGRTPDRPAHRESDGDDRDGGTHDDVSNRNNIMARARGTGDNVPRV